MKLNCRMLLAILLVMAACWYFTGERTMQILDGPGMVYEWTDYELRGEWIEVGVSAEDSPCRLSFGKDSFTFTGWDGKTAEYRYSLPEGVDPYGKPEGEVYLETEDFTEFDDLIFHEETIDGYGDVPVISVTFFEYDGRGEIVFTEFVRTDDLKRLPDDFRSSAWTRRNDSEPVPTADFSGEPILKDEPEEGDLIRNGMFYALLPKNRYGGSSHEGDYAEGRFLIWVDPVEVCENGEIVNEEPVAVPYIVSDDPEKRNDENLSMLSGGRDGLDPYGDTVYAVTTDENGEIIDVVDASVILYGAG